MRRPCLLKKLSLVLLPRGESLSQGLVCLAPLPNVCSSPNEQTEPVPARVGPAGLGGRDDVSVLACEMGSRFAAYSCCGSCGRPARPLGAAVTITSRRTRAQGRGTRSCGARVRRCAGPGVGRGWLASSSVSRCRVWISRYQPVTPSALNSSLLKLPFRSQPLCWCCVLPSAPNCPDKSTSTFFKWA